MPPPASTGADRLLALSKLAETSILSVSTSDVFRQALDCLAQVIPHDRASILMFDPDGVMRFKAWRNLSPEFRRAMQWMSPWARDVWSSDPIVITSGSEGAAQDELRDLLLGEGIQVSALFSIGVGGAPLGKLMVARLEPRAFAEDELRAGRA